MNRLELHIQKQPEVFTSYIDEAKPEIKEAWDHFSKEVKTIVIKQLGKYAEDNDVDANLEADFTKDHDVMNKLIFAQLQLMINDLIKEKKEEFRRAM